MHKCPKCNSKLSYESKNDISRLICPIHGVVSTSNLSRGDSIINY